MAQQLDPALIALLMGQPEYGNSYGQQKVYTDPVTGQTYSAQRNYEKTIQGDNDVISGMTPWTLHQQTGANSTNAFDEQGNYLGPQGGMSENMMLALLALSAAGGAYAGGAFGGAGAAGSGAAGATGAAGGSVTLPTMAELGVGAASVTPELLAGMPAVNMGAAAAGGAAGSGLLNSSPGTSGVNSMRAGEIGGYSTNGAMPSSAAVPQGTGGTGFDPSSLLSGQNLAGLAGAVAGAAGAKDQTQTTSRDPWGPAQPFLRGLLDQGQQLQKQYTDNPFSDTQKMAYGNQAGLLNAINQAAPGLLGGMQQNASGANNYDRTNPRRQLTGSNPQFNWNPGLLNYFPPKG